MLREDILEDLDEHKKERLGYGKNIKMVSHCKANTYNQ